MEWVKYMTSPKVQSKLVYTKAFKARGPNMKIVDYWDDDQKKLLSYVRIRPIRARCWSRR